MFFVIFSKWWFWSKFNIIIVFSVKFFFLKMCTFVNFYALKIMSNTILDKSNVYRVVPLNLMVVDLVEFFHMVKGDSIRLGGGKNKYFPMRRVVTGISERRNAKFVTSH